MSTLVGLESRRLYGKLKITFQRADSLVCLAKKKPSGFVALGLFVLVLSCASCVCVCHPCDQEIFVDFNKWTRAYNFLLVEKLSSSTQEEEWAEIASQCDDSPTYETEAFQAKARRKYAAAKGLAFEAVSLKDVEQSDLGLKGYADLVITVPGIEVIDEDKDRTQNIPKPKHFPVTSLPYWASL